MKMLKNMGKWPNTQKVLFGILLLIILISILTPRNTNNYLSAGIGMQGHLGNLKGSFNIETMQGQESNAEQEESGVQNMGPQDMGPQGPSSEDMGMMQQGMGMMQQGMGMAQNMGAQGMDMIKNMGQDILQGVGQMGMMGQNILQGEGNMIESMTGSMNGGDSEIVLFFAPWCGHCKRMMPAWESLGPQVGNVKVNKVDCDANQDLAKNNGVQGYPTVIYFANGMSAGNGEVYDGDRDADSLRNWISAKGAVSTGPNNGNSAPVGYQSSV